MREKNELLKIGQKLHAEKIIKELHKIFFIIITSEAFDNLKNLSRIGDKENTSDVVDLSKQALEYIEPLMILMAVYKQKFAAKFETSALSIIERSQLIFDKILELYKNIDNSTEMQTEFFADIALLVQKFFGILNLGFAKLDKFLKFYEKENYAAIIQEFEQFIKNNMEDKGLSNNQEIISPDDNKEVTNNNRQIKISTFGNLKEQIEEEVAEELENISIASKIDYHKNTDSLSVLPQNMFWKEILRKLDVNSLVRLREASKSLDQSVKEKVLQDVANLKIDENLKAIFQFLPVELQDFLIYKEAHLNESFLKILQLNKDKNIILRLLELYEPDFDYKNLLLLLATLIDTEKSVKKECSINVDQFYFNLHLCRYHPGGMLDDQYFTEKTETYFGLQDNIKALEILLTALVDADLTLLVTSNTHQFHLLTFQQICVYFGFERLISLLEKNNRLPIDHIIVQLAIRNKRENLVIRWIREEKININMKVGDFPHLFFIALKYQCQRVCEELLNSPYLSIKSYSSKEGELAAAVEFHKKILQGVLKNKINSDWLSNLVIRELDFRDCKFDNKNIYVSQEQELTLLKCNLEKISFENSGLQIKYRSCNLKQANFSNARILLQSIVPFKESSKHEIEYSSLNDLKGVNFFATKIVYDVKNKKLAEPVIKLLKENSCGNLYFATFIPDKGDEQNYLPDLCKKAALSAFLYDLQQQIDFTATYQMFSMLKDATYGLLRASKGIFSSSYEDTAEYRGALLAVCQQLYGKAEEKDLQYFPKIITELKRCQPTFFNKEWETLIKKFENFKMESSLEPGQRFQA